MRRNRKWKIPHTVLERWTMRFSSYRNCELKVKVWWVGARERKNRIFCNVYLLRIIFFFNFFFISMYIVLNKLSEGMYTFTYQKFYFIHFCCLFLKLSKTFSASLTANPTKWSNTLKQFVGSYLRIVWMCLTIL